MKLYNTNCRYKVGVLRSLLQKTLRKTSQKYLILINTINMIQAQIGLDQFTSNDEKNKDQHTLEVSTSITKLKQCKTRTNAPLPLWAAPFSLKLYHANTTPEKPMIIIQRHVLTTQKCFCLTQDIDSLGYHSCYDSKPKLTYFFQNYFLYSHKCNYKQKC